MPPQQARLDIAHACSNHKNTLLLQSVPYQACQVASSESRPCQVACTRSDIALLGDDGVRLVKAGEFAVGEYNGAHDHYHKRHEGGQRDPAGQRDYARSPARWIHLEAAA